MKTFTQRCSQKWQTLIAGGVKTFLVLFLLSFFVTDTKAQVTIGQPTISDWCSAVSNSQVKPHLKVEDILNGTGDDTEFNKGTSDVLDIPDWSWGVGNISGKTDLGNVGLVVDGCTIYFFADRYAAEGDADLGLWLFKDGTVQNVEGGSFTGEHQEGDILITSKFTNGGGVMTVKVYIWTGGELELLFDTAVDPTKESIASGYVVQSATPVPCGWNYTGKFGTPGNYEPGTFFEGRLNLCLLDLAYPELESSINECFANFIFKTSQSPSPTSANGDLVFGNINSQPAKLPLTANTFCTGTGSGTVSFENSVVGVSYTLQQLVNAAYVDVANTTVAGDGGTITYNNLAAGTYRVKAVNTNTNSLCTTYFDPVTVTSITANGGTGSANQTICGPSADPTELSVTGASTGTYQWQSNTTGCEGTWVNINNATGATYDPPAGLAITTYYRRVTTVTQGAVNCPAPSTCITVTINNVTAGTIAGNQTLCGPSVDPAAFTVTVAATGTATPTYQWQSKPGTCEDGGTWTNIATNGTSATYDVPAGLTATTSYRRIATSTVNTVACPATSNCITVTVNNITAGTIAGNQTLCGPANPDPFTVTVAATGTATPTYQWQSKPGTCESEGTWTNIATNGTSATYDVPAGLAATTSYRRIATSTVNNVACPATSNCITVTVNATPAAPILSKVDNCNGTTTITAKDGNGVNIPAGELTWIGTSETGNPIIVSTTAPVTATRTVGGCTSPASNSVTPAPITPPGAPTGIPNSGCIGQQITLGASGCTGTYKWYETNISATVLGTGSSFTTPSLSESKTYYVSCTVGGCEGPRTPVTASVTACGSYCTYTQGAWGSKGGKMCDGEGKGDYSTIGMLEHALDNWGTDGLIIGSNGNTIKITAAQCVLDLLPGGGKSYVLNGAATTCDQIKSKYATEKPRDGYKINNTLLAQTIALGLNLGINDNLASFSFADHSMTNKYLKTQELASCGSTSVVPNSITCDLIDPAVIALLKRTNWPASGSGDYPATVSGLYALANYALGGQSLANTGGVTLESIASVVDAINNAFDECRAFVGFSADACSASNRMVTPSIETSVVVTTSPNPYSDRIRFVITSEVSGQASLELYNLTGQKVATPFRGYINAGRAQNVEYSVPASSRGNLIYRVVVKDRFTTGKVVSLHK